MTIPMPPTPRKMAPAASLNLPEVLKHAQALLRQHELDQAATLYEWVLQDQPGQPDALHYLGLIKHFRGQHEEALRLIRKSIKRMPGQAWPWNNLGNVLNGMQRHDEALKAYQQCIRIDPRHAEGFCSIAGLLRRHGEVIKAEASCREALRLQPDYGLAWYLLARILTQQRRLPEAIEANRRGEQLAPQDTDSRDKVCRALVAAGEKAEAARIYREWLARDPDNPVVRHHLAAISEDPTPERAPDDYVENVFDGFADTFDEKLASLGYRAPQIIAEHLKALLPPAAGGYRVGDLGCGTGLVGPLVRQWSSTLVGCDLSEGMLAKARPRGVYDELVKAELVAFLRERPAAFDVLISADTLCYFGDLSALAQSARQALGPGGLLCFTVEASDEDAEQGYLLQPHGRYAHTAAYLEATLRAHGFAPAPLIRQVLRKEAGAPVSGWLVTARLAE